MRARALLDAWISIAIALLSAACSSTAVPDASAIPDAHLAAPATTGARCTANGECNSNICLPSGVCASRCLATSDCPNGWNCEIGAAAPHCVCPATPETCDGVDNDCDGLVDDGLPSCSCPRAAESRCGAICTRLASDRANCGACGHACASTESCAGGQCIGAKLDVLFVIDNSGSMNPNQRNLLEQLAGFVGQLTHPTTGAIPVASLQAGVVSTDLGTPGSSVPGCANSDLGDDGLLNPIRFGLATARHEPWIVQSPTSPRPLDCTDPNEFPPFLSFDSATGDPVQFDHDLRCNAGLYGGDGCGLEAPLEAAYRALVLHDARDTPGNVSPNAGFVRRDATLAIVVLTDEDDGSVRDCRMAQGMACEGEGALDVYNPASTNWSNMELNLRFYMYQPCSMQDPTWSLDRYVDPADPSGGFYALKPADPERIVFAAITGIPLGRGAAGADATGHIDWDELLGAPGEHGPHAFCERDSTRLASIPSDEGLVSMAQANADVACSNRVVPACRREGTVAAGCTLTEQYFAWPARRVVEVARRFDQVAFCDDGGCHNGLVDSICQADYAATMSRIAVAIQSRL